MIKDHQFLPASFLTERTLTVEVAESENLVQTKVLPDPVPFGHLYDEWLKLKRRIRDGDELREFRTPICSGIAIIRKDRIVTFMAIRMNPKELQQRQSVSPGSDPADDPWRLIERGEFDQAVEEYTKWIAEGKPGYANRGIAYLNLGRLDHARADFVSGEQHSSLRSEHHLQWMGAIDWLSGNPQQAKAIWHETVLRIREGTIRYTDAAGGVSSGLLLWFASLMLGDKESTNHAIDFLDSRIVKRNGGRWSATLWPAALARFAIGDGIAENLLTSMDMRPILKERHHCQAYFYIGVRAFSRGDNSGAVAAWQESVAQKKLIEIEHYLALHQLQNVRADVP